MTTLVPNTLASHLTNLSNRCLASYREHPSLVLEQANIERSIMQGGYSRRQLYELIQNAADAIGADSSGRIHVVLTDDALYCANEGASIDATGVEALLLSHASQKRNAEIGRFGLGFKSVLEISESPQLLSEAVSFGFDSFRSAMMIREIVPTAKYTPTLRLAWPLDLPNARTSDPLLNELMGWATTVIRLPLRPEIEDAWLSEDIEAFPAEFLLFSPHVRRLDLEDRTRGLHRSISVVPDGGELALQELDEKSRWRVFRRQHRPSGAARKNASSINDRETVPIMWAVPLSNRRIQRRKFWAFFPTMDETTLSGIINAPWKTNEDRQNLLPGRFNEELLDIVAAMVAENIALVNDKDDPGYYLQLLPAREDEPYNWAESYLNRRVYEELSRVPCLPDQHGELRLISEMLVQPENLPDAALEAWRFSPAIPSNWLHRKADTRQRRNRVKRLMDLQKATPTSFETWLLAAVATPSPEASNAAITTAAAVAAQSPLFKASISTAAIVLTTLGELVPPNPGHVFLPSDQDALQLTVVHPDVAANEAAWAALREFGITMVDATSRLTALLTSRRPELFDHEDWLLLWSLISGIDSQEAISLLKKHEFSGQSLHVHTRARAFRPIERLLLPGQIVGVEAGVDTAVTIDTDFHEANLEILRSFGATGTPGSIARSRSLPNWLLRYRDEIRKLYLHSLPPGSSRPQEDKLILDGHLNIGPLDAFFELSDQGKIRFAEALIPQIERQPQWRMIHASQAKYPALPVQSPYVWALREFGRVSTSLGILPVAEAAGPALSDYADLLPVADCPPRTAELLRLPNSLPNIPSDFWEGAIELAGYIEDPQEAGDAYARIAPHFPAPPRIHCFVDDQRALLPTGDITIVESEADLESYDQPYLKVESRTQARILIDQWDMRRPAPMTARRLHTVAVGEEESLIRHFPGLAAHLSEEQRRIVLIPCESIRFERPTDAGLDEQTRHSALVESALYWEQSLGPEPLLSEVEYQLELHLNPNERHRILSDKADHDRELTETKRQQLLDTITTAPTMPSKLLTALGVEALRSHIPENLLRAYQDRNGRPTTIDVAELAIAHFGYDVLREYTAELVTAGLQPPARWRRNQEARNFVRSIGFPDEYAGFDQPRIRPAVIEIHGRVSLKPLHPFQQTITERIRALMVATRGRRGVLSLPTGAGKTRVTVESIVRSLETSEITGPVLWIAQSDELCEQAVQTWADVWHALGPADRLVISRLWSSNSATPVSNGYQVVVATIQKLQKLIENRAYAWLFDTTPCVIIDEAHSSIAPTYTRLLERVGLGRAQSRDRTTLLGLTATPFRGGEDETSRLVYRYGGTRLDAGILGDNPYNTLQEMRILSEVDHEVLAGSNIVLDKDELAHLEQLHELPTSAETRIGQDLHRNNEIVDKIKHLDDSWPVLLFATSVEHAQIMAALLTTEGVRAASISNGTDIGQRRRLIQEFRSGEIRVLTNFGVLTTGFDAPSIRALIVARPTYSPVLYQQMVGRGLRGPLNGGKDRCLIVNVADNVAQYGEELAFRKFEFLWNIPRST